MIEFKSKFLTDDWRNQVDWQEIGTELLPTDIDFEHHYIRINGKKYGKITKEFLEAYEKERVWGKLSD